MGWITRKLDQFVSAIAGGAGGMGLSQAPAFTHAYLQRLGGHIDEARRTAQRADDGRLLPHLADPDRADLGAALAARVDELLGAEQAIREAPALLQPLALVRHADLDIARRTLETFQPALPLDLASLTWTGIGIVLALLIYELIAAALSLLKTAKAPTPGTKRH